VLFPSIPMLFLCYAYLIAIYKQALEAPQARAAMQILPDNKRSVTLKNL